MTLPREAAAFLGLRQAEGCASAPSPSCFEETTVCLTDWSCCQSQPGVGVVSIEMSATHFTALHVTTGEVVHSNTDNLDQIMEDSDPIHYSGADNRSAHLHYEYPPRSYPSAFTQFTGFWLFTAPGGWLLCSHICASIDRHLRHSIRAWLRIC